MTITYTGYNLAKISLYLFDCTPLLLAYYLIYLAQKDLRMPIHMPDVYLKIQKKKKWMPQLNKPVKQITKSTIKDNKLVHACWNAQGYFCCNS